MRSFLLKSLLFFLIVPSIFSQRQHPEIAAAIENVNIDSLLSYVRILSGEDSVLIDGERTLIKNRRFNNEGNKLAERYLFGKLSSFGLNTEVQTFQKTVNPEGENVIAVQTGTQHPNDYYIICGHYDSVTDYCADDNASGTAAVIEAARIISKLQPHTSIIYALWDQEEIGLYGSSEYADKAGSGKYRMDIKAVINLDMISYDEDNDHTVQLHTLNKDEAREVAGFVEDINTDYEIDLNIEKKIPGSTASDHAPFLNNDYPALMIIESLNDFNPYYHTSQDRINLFNTAYYHKTAKLAVGSLAGYTLGETVLAVDDEEIEMDFILHQNYPNPFNPSTTIKFTIPTSSLSKEKDRSEVIKLSVYNILGQKVKTLINDNLAPGSYEVQFNGEDLSSGVYLYKLQYGNFVKSKKMILTK